MTAEVDWETNKAQCPKCKRHFKIGAFSRDGEKCNSCVAREERHAVWWADLIANLPDYTAVNWQAYSTTKSGFRLLCGLRGVLEMAGSLEAAAKHLQVNTGLISRVLNGGDSPTLRRCFNLPEKEMAAVSPCVDCGEIHTLDYCPEKNTNGNFIRSDWLAERDRLREKIEELESEKAELLSMDTDDLRMWYMKAGEKFKEDPKPIKPNPPLYRKRKQIRLAASVTKEERQALRDLANEHNLTWSEYCRRLAAERMENG